MLSPVWELGRPDVVILRDGRAYRRLFSGLFSKRSPTQVNKKGLFQSFLQRSSLLKLEHDLLLSYDISVVPYPVRHELRAWGLVVHPAGRIMGLSARHDGLMELNYQSGYCRSRQDWHRLAEDFTADEEEIRRFYNQARVLAGDQIILAGTLGFGLWDALWMAFDFKRACELLEEDEDFVRSVAKHWLSYHVKAVSAMLDTGVKLIVVRENPQGFPSYLNMADRLESYLGESYRELCETVHDRGGSLLLDCDADDVFDTEIPELWGFDGIGPLLFRDEEDLKAARKSLNEEMILVGTVVSPTGRPPVENTEFPEGLIVTHRPASKPCRIDSDTAYSSDVPANRTEDFRLAV